MSTIGVIGMGYVGLPLAVRAAEAGHAVYGVDLDAKKIASLKRGESYVEDVESETLKILVDGDWLVPVLPSDYLFSLPVDVIIIAVPTPVDAAKVPDLTYVISAAEMAGKWLRPGGTVVLESTTYPGTTEELVADTIEKFSGMRPIRDYHLGYSPERINPGDKVHTLVTTPKIVSGVGPAALDAVKSVYDDIVDTTVPVSSPSVAELAKVFENTFAFVNVALVNELALICSQLGLDVDEVLDAAATKGHNFLRYKPGPGVGGHCLPVDPLYLAHHMKTRFGSEFRFARLADEVNSFMPHHVARRVTQIAGRPLNDLSVLVLGQPDDVSLGPFYPCTTVAPNAPIKLEQGYVEMGPALWAVDRHGHYSTKSSGHYGDLGPFTTRRPETIDYSRRLPP